MTLEKALEYFDLETKGLMDYNDPEWIKAKKLGIEALRRLEHDRQWGAAVSRKLLPGETEEYCKLCGIAHTDTECPDRGGEK